MPSPIAMTARHFAKRAPMPRYSASRSRRPSRPSVTFSLGEPASCALVLEEPVEGGSVGGALADGFVEEDHAADEFVGAFGAEQHLAVVAPVLFGGRDVDALEALLDGGRALVRGEDALAGRDDRTCGFFEVGHGR
jgi:hypothetical protein